MTQSAVILLRTSAISVLAWLLAACGPPRCPRPYHALGIRRVGTSRGECRGAQRASASGALQAAARDSVSAVNPLVLPLPLLH